MGGKYLALILRPGHLTVATVRGGNLLTSREISLPHTAGDVFRLDPADLTESLRSLQLPKLPCILVLSSHFLISRQLTLPRMGENQLLRSLPFSFRDWIAQPSSALYGYHITHIGDASMELSVSAVSADFLEDVCRAFHRVGLQLRSVLPEEAAWVHFLSGKQIQGTSAILDHQNCLHIFSQGKLLLSRELPMDPLALRQTLNLFNSALPPQASPVERLYCAEPLPESIPGIAMLPLSQLLPDCAGSADPLLAVGSSFWAVSRHRNWNLIRHRRSFRPGFVALYSGICCAALLIFLQLGVIAPLHAYTQATAELSQAQSRLASAQTALQQYAEVEQAYLQLGQPFLQPEEKDLVPRSQVLDLICGQIRDRASVANLVIRGNTLTMDLLSVSLEEAGELLAALEQTPLVSQASMLSATASDGNATVLISISLTRQEEPSHETN